MTNDRNDERKAAEAILRQIDAYGADPARWPKPVGDAKALRDPAVANDLREAAALDRLLAMAAPKKASADKDLIDRIVAAAERTPRVVTQNAAQAITNRAATVETPRAKDTVVSLRRPTPTTRVWSTDLRRGFAVLAASLVLGLSIGQLGIMDRALVGLEDITGVAMAPVSQEIAGALSEDASGEDL